MSKQKKNNNLTIDDLKVSVKQVEKDIDKIMHDFLMKYGFRVNKIDIGGSLFPLSKIHINVK